MPNPTLSGAATSGPPFSRQEMRKITWPDRTQLRQATIAIIVFVLIIGAVIALLVATRLLRIDALRTALIVTSIFGLRESCARQAHARSPRTCTRVYPHVAEC